MGPCPGTPINDLKEKKRLDRLNNSDHSSQMPDEKK